MKLNKKMLRKMILREVKNFRKNVINEEAGDFGGAVNWLKIWQHDNPADAKNPKELLKALQGQSFQLVTTHEQKLQVIDIVLNNPKSIQSLIDAYIDKNPWKGEKHPRVLGNLTVPIAKLDWASPYKRWEIRAALAKKLGIIDEGRKLTRGTLRKMILNELKKRK